MILNWKHRSSKTGYRKLSETFLFRSLSMKGEIVLSIIFQQPEIKIDAKEKGETLFEKVLVSRQRQNVTSND